MAFKRPLRRQTLDEILEGARAGKTLLDVTDGLLGRRHLADAEGRAAINAILRDTSLGAQGYKLQGRTQHEADAKRLGAERRHIYERHAARSLFALKREHASLLETLARFEKAERQAPTTEEVILRMTGDLGVTLDQMLMMAAFEEAALRNVREEIKVATPSQRLELYERAAGAQADLRSAVVLRVMENERPAYAEGVAKTASEIDAATRLGRLIDETQAARVPDVTEVREILAEMNRVIKSADRQGIRAVNPDHPTLETLEPLPEPIAVEE
jgi:hypothetical protein